MNTNSKPKIKVHKNSTQHPLVKSQSEPRGIDMRFIRDYIKSISVENGIQDLFNTFGLDLPKESIKETEGFNTILTTDPPKINKTASSSFYNYKPIGHVVNVDTRSGNKSKIIFDDKSLRRSVENNKEVRVMKLRKYFILYYLQQN